MGVVHKLRPEVINFILEKKKNAPSLSCRAVAKMLDSELKVKVSKSSINALFKEAALSLPVGRRSNRPKKLKLPAIPLPAIKDLILVDEKPQPQYIEPVLPVEPVVAEPIISPAPSAAIEPEPVAAQAPEEIKLPEVEEKLEEPVAENPVEEPAQVEQTPPVEELPVEIKQEEPISEPIKATAQPVDDIPFEMVGAELESFGAVILKAVDHLLGGSMLLSEAINRHIYRPKRDLLALTEGAIFAPLFEEKNVQSGLSALLQKKLSLDIMQSYLDEVKSISSLPLDYSEIASHLSKEVRAIKLVLSDSETIYLDGQLHTVWSTSQLPYDFSIAYSKIKNYINRYFRESQPFLLFMAPGYEKPIKEFFSFIDSFSSSGKKIRQLVLYDNKLQELETIHLEQAQNRFLMFGLWPWQFSEYRKVKKLGEFKPYDVDALLRQMYFAPIEIEITQPNENKHVALTGYAVKASLSEKTRLVILSNIPTHLAPTKELADTYFNSWSNLEEGFQDFSRKIELFTYTASSQRSFSAESLTLAKKSGAQTKDVLLNYLQILDLYVRYHFLPPAFQEQSFEQTKEHFYNLKLVLKKEKTGISAIFKPPSGYAYLKELVYLCRRFNEQEIMLNHNNQLWLRV